MRRANPISLADHYEGVCSDILKPICIVKVLLGVGIEVVFLKRERDSVEFIAKRKLTVRLGIENRFEVTFESSLCIEMFTV